MMEHHHPVAGLAVTMRTLADGTNAGVVVLQGRVARRWRARDLQSLLLPTTFDDAQRMQAVASATPHSVCGARGKLRHTTTARILGGRVITST
jgi:hypothetical protein